MENLPAEIVNTIMSYVLESKTNRIMKDAIINHKPYKVDDGIDFFNWYFFNEKRYKSTKNFFMGKLMDSIISTYRMKNILFYQFGLDKIEINDNIWSEHEGTNPLKYEKIFDTEIWKEYHKKNGWCIFRGILTPD